MGARRHGQRLPVRLRPEGRCAHVRRKSGSAAPWGRSRSRCSRTFARVGFAPLARAMTRVPLQELHVTYHCRRAMAGVGRAPGCLNCPQSQSPSPFAGGYACSRFDAARWLGRRSRGRATASPNARNSGRFSCSRHYHCRFAEGLLPSGFPRMTILPSGRVKRDRHGKQEGSRPEAAVPRARGDASERGGLKNAPGGRHRFGQGNPSFSLGWIWLDLAQFGPIWGIRLDFPWIRYTSGKATYPSPEGKWASKARPGIRAGFRLRHASHNSLRREERGSAHIGNRGKFPGGKGALTKAWLKPGMSLGSIDSLERMTPTELVGLVRRLVGEVERLRGENEKLSAALAGQRVENQALKDEIARLKHLPPRPPHKPSGMEKATDSRRAKRRAMRTRGRSGGAAPASRSFRSTARKRFRSRRRRARAPRASKRSSFRTWC